MGRVNRRASPLWGVACIGLTLAVVIGSGTGGFFQANAWGDSRRFSSPLLSFAGAEYAVTFTERGLPSGTEWSVILNGTQESSSTSTITFSEPNGQYLFTVAPISGYNAGPEGNISVSGAPVNFSILFTPNSPPSQGQSCTSFSWQEKNYTLHGNCNGFFETDYRWFNATTGYTFGNSTFDLAAVAEVNSSGDLDALAIPGYHGAGQMTVAYSSTEINVTDVITGNVTTVVDLNGTTYAPTDQAPEWTPTQAPGAGGPTYWSNGADSLGTVTIIVVFHFDNQSGAASKLVKFDVKVNGWPWVSSSDTLGLALGATAEQGTYFAYSSVNDTISQTWDSNGTVAASLKFGPSANATGPSSPVAVSNQVVLMPSGSHPISAVALLMFEGTGGYSGLVYDPWIIFGAGTPSVTVPPPPPPAVAGGATLPLLAVGGIAIGAFALGVLAYRARHKPIDEGLDSFA